MNRSKTHNANRSRDQKSDTCVVCCRDIFVYAIGVCDHPVCHECSTRMRVLCRKNECPICRQNLPQVAFTIKKTKFANLNLRNCSREQTYDIIFDGSRSEEEYYGLLEHTCNICKNQSPQSPFSNFIQLKDHMRRVHERFYCNLCVENIKLFSFERQTYNRIELANHRRLGDADNTSLRGHPLCEFCDERYMDEDDLFKHLRKDHYFCHFCDVDGSNVFYCNYNSLRDHFRKEHYLCEEGSCINEQFTSVFRTDIDFKAHKAQTHNKNLTKFQARQARTIELDFPTSRLRFQQHHPEKHLSDDNVVEKSRTFRKNQKVENASGQALTAELSRQATFAKDDSGAKLNFSSDFPVLDTNAKTIEAAYSASAWQGAKKLGLGNDVAESFPMLTSKAVPLPYNTWVSTESTPCSKASSSVSKPSTSKSSSASKHSIKSQMDFPSLEKPKHPIPSLKQIITKPKPITPSPSMGPNATPKQNSVKQKTKLQNSPRTNDEDAFIKPVDTVINNNKVKLIDPVDNISLSLPGPTPVLKVTKEDFPELGAPKSPNATRSLEQKNSKQPKVKLKSEGSNQKSNQKHETSSTSLGGKSKRLNLQGLANSLKNSSLDKPKKKNRKGSKANKNENIENERQVQENSLLNGSASKQVFENSSTEFTNNSSSSYSGSKSDIFMLGLLDNKPRKGFFDYVPPDNFQQRNLDLIKKIQMLSNNSSSSFGEFKTLSGHFRRNLITADAYYAKCVAMFGNLRFSEVFPELLVLLPDIDKQTELLVVYVAESDKSSVEKYFKVCSICQQVLAPYDFSLHKFTHRG